MTSSVFEPASGAPGLPSGWMRVNLGPGFDGHAAALMSARPGGISRAPYDACNLGDHVRDDPAHVAHNRRVFAQALEAEPVWMTQVHGNRIVRLSRGGTGMSKEGLPLVDPATQSMQPCADGAITTEPGLACTVMVADCLPLLLVAPQGRGVAALHAGWRGLAGAGDMQGRGIVHAGVRALCEATGADPADLRAWLGPCIGPAQFEVGADVLAGFGVDPSDAAGHPRFKARHGKDARDPALPAGPNELNGPAKWLADLPGLARDTLATLGVPGVDGGQWCTVSDASRFFSFRRDGVTGRQAVAVHLR